MVVNAGAHRVFEFRGIVVATPAGVGAGQAAGGKSAPRRSGSVNATGRIGVGRLAREKFIAP
jgi:hypothetical protein